MLRFAFAVLAGLALPGAAGAEEDNGPDLVDVFARTCAQRPALPSDLARASTALGFTSDGGQIGPDLEAGPKIDIVYTARATKKSVKYGLSAYFDGPGGDLTVSCGVTAHGISSEKLLNRVEKAFAVRDRKSEPVIDGKPIRLRWMFGADGDILEMSAHAPPPRRAGLNLSYRARKR